MLIWLVWDPKFNVHKPETYLWTQRHPEPDRWEPALGTLFRSYEAAESVAMLLAPQHMLEGERVEIVPAERLLKEWL
jgi:hypothetical protein